ncbi:hypothetical protein A9D46_11660 [Photobacterium damselae subsp. damselae]|nr:hypothetical protein A9D46_11660 [Photobacterium damselae subsp. damselae]
MIPSIIIIVTLLFLNCCVFLYIIKMYMGKYILLLYFPIFLHFILNFIGVLNLGFITSESTVGINISDAIREQIPTEFFISILVLNLFFLLFVKFLGVKKFDDSIKNYLTSNYVYTYSRRLLILTIMVLVIDSFAYGLPAGYYAIIGDPGMAAFQKGIILKAKISNGIPIFGYFVNYLPYFTFVNLLLWYISTGKGKKYLIILIMVFFVYSFLTLVKSYLMMPMLFSLWCLLCLNKLRLSHIIKFILFLIPVLYLVFSSLSTSDSTIAYLFFKRVFLVQAEGMFIIRDLYQTSDLGALFYSSPFRHIMDVHTFDPAAEIVAYYFGRESGWVNMNSFYAGQGYVMFGYFYILVIPFLIFFQYLFINKLFSRLVNVGLLSILMVSFFILLPLSNNIANIVWFKDIIAFVLILPLLKRYKL